MIPLIVSLLGKGLEAKQKNEQEQQQFLNSFGSSTPNYMNSRSLLGGRFYR